MAVKNFSCSCGSGIGYLGLPTCVSQPRLIRKDFFFPMFNDDNERNSIKASDFENGVLPESFIRGQLTHLDPSRRWQTTPGQYEQAAPSRTDRTVFESDTGTRQELRKGQRVRQFELLDVPDSWSAKINAAKCVEMAVISIDESGAMIGEVSKDGTEFYGLPVQKNTLYADAMEATADKGSHTMIGYQISRLMEEGLLLTISADQIESDLLQARSPIEVDLTQNEDNANTVTEVFVDAFNTTLGTFGRFEALKAATDPADWKVYETKGTEGVEIAVTAVEEIERGKYKLTLATNTSAKAFVSFVKVKSSSASIGYAADQIELDKPAA